MDEDIIPDSAIILVKSKPLEHESEHHGQACSAKVIAVHMFGTFSAQVLFDRDLCTCTCVYTRADICIHMPPPTHTHTQRIEFYNLYQGISVSHTIN
jgi:hypothetical protein